MNTNTSVSFQPPNSFEGIENFVEIIIIEQRDIDRKTVTISCFEDISSKKDAKIIALIMNSGRDLDELKNIKTCKKWL